MCKNHSHAVATSAIMLADGAGINVILAQVATDMAVEDGFTGMKLIAPQGATLLIVSQSEGAASFLPDRVMEALAVLLSMDLTMLPNNGGGINPLTPKMP
jgi:hypothetical protein